MVDGKKSTAEQIVYGCLDLVAERAKDDPLKVWDRALGNVKPKVEVKSRRVGGSTYQVPVDVRHDRSQALGIAADHFGAPPQRDGWRELATIPTR